MPNNVLTKLGIESDNAGCAIGRHWRRTSGKPLIARSPIDGSTLAQIRSAQAVDVNAAAEAAHEAFLKWRLIPAPKRGELVRRIGQKLRERKSDLAALVSLEAGKITSEALGEVQEMIDVAD